jgi:50S ribosomal subunit-associated GTPase HflX
VRQYQNAGDRLEDAEVCREADVDAAVFVNALTPLQRTVLTGVLGCLVFSGHDLAAGGRIG